MKRMMISVAGTVAVAAAACAGDRTWNGGGGDANWGTSANWGGTSPVADDALYFGGSAKLANTNDLAADTSFAGLTFNSGAGAFALAGNRLTLGGNVTNWSSNTQTLNLPVFLSATRDVNATNGAVTVNGVLSGAGGLTKLGPQTLTLTASNSYEGVTTVSNGLLAISHGSALGSTNGNTVVRSAYGGYLQLSGNITVAEPLTLNAERPNYGSSLLNSSGSNTLSGLITRQGQTRINSNSGTTLVITGGMAGPGGGLCVINSGGTISFYNTPLNIGSDQFYTDSGGLTVMGVAGNTWGETLVAGGTLRMDIANGLPAATVLRIGISYSAGGTVNLNGFDQSVAQLRNDTTNAGTRILTSLAPATLTVNQSVNSLYDGQLTGALSLTKIGTGTLTLSNSLSTTTGNITVTNGTLLVALASSLGNSTNVTVAGATGILELRTSSGVADAASLSIANGGAKVKIGTNLTETVGKLFLGGVQQANGTWGPSGSGATHIDDAHFTGGGKIYVVASAPITAVSATWDAGGGDTFLSTTNNWAGDVLPAFGGATYAVFGTGGSTATVDTAASLYGMAFNANTNFTVAAGAGIITNGAGGITAAIPTTASRTYTVSEDIVLADHQTWGVTNNGAGVTTLLVSGKIDDGVDPYNLTLSGNGVLVLSGNNTYDGTTTVRTNGVLRITHANALGSTNGATVVDNGGRIEMSGGINVAEPLTINGDPSTGYQGVIRSTSGSNVLSGVVTSSSRIRANSGSLDIIGGIVGAGIVLGADGGALIRISGKPINIGGGSFYAHTGNGPLILAVTNNTWGYLEVGGSLFRTDLPNALPPTATLDLSSSSAPSSIVDLNGNSQTVGQFQTGYTSPDPKILYSVVPATLTVNQSATTTFNGSITGAVSLVKAGAGSLTLSGTNTTYGSFVVSNGTLLVSGSLGVNCTNVVVAAGTLTLSNSVTIADNASLIIANGAKVNLASGVYETVGYLYCGGVQKRAGTYSAASGSGVQVVDTDHFAGTGILKVLHDKSGTIMRVQ